MRLAYFGTPLAAVAPLRALVAAGHDVGPVVTQPDRKRGRGSALVASPVKRAACELGLSVLTPARSREVVDEVGVSGAEVAVVVAFGQLLPAELLAVPPLGFVNVHFSLLPRWRGAAPVERAILAGDAETGVAIMAVDEGLDTGAIYAETSTPIGADETAGELSARLVALGTELLLATLPRLREITPRPQTGTATYATKLQPAEFRLDPHQPADELARLVRAANPRPGAWCTLTGRRLKVLRAAAVPEPTDLAGSVGSVDDAGVLVTASGGLALTEVQPEGRSAMTGSSWRRGLHDDAVRIDPAPPSDAPSAS
jgi:methionyl-tRNA formyltransferase